MNTISEYQQRLLDLAAAGALILTANRRLARHLREQYDRRMQRSGIPAWQAPKIMSLDLWVRSSIEKAGLAGQVLEAAAAQTLWERIIAADPQLAAHGTAWRRLASVAAEAHRLLEEYQVPAERVPLTPDQEAFAAWRGLYRQRLAAESWLDPGGMLTALLQLLLQREVALPERMILAGFDELSPRIQQLLAAVRAAGVTVEEAPPPHAPQGAVLRVAVAADRREELRQVARWVRRLLEEGEGNIGVVVPDLRSYRLEVEQIFREELDPVSLTRPNADEQLFSLSLGAPLGEHPPVRAALEFLALTPVCDLDQVGFLLRSPFLGGWSKEMHGRGLCDVRLRRQGMGEISLDTLADAAQQAREGQRLPLLAGVLRRLKPLLRDRSLRLPSAWSNEFLSLLSAVGWPGDRPLSSSEYQLCRTLRDQIIVTLTAFDRVTGPVARGEALALLRQAAAERDFQPESPSGPVQVVGFLEAGGLFFRHLWLVGLTADVLPAPPRPNPLLPYATQVHCGLPHASVERELLFARRILARLLAAAPAVVVSHPLREGDSDLLPSPLIAGIPSGMPPALAPSHDPALLWHAEARLETYPSGDGLPVSAGTPVRGGIGVLRDQAHCPFRAFARHRLSVRGLDEPEPGIDAATRGSLLHRALELFWRAAGGSAALRALSPEQLRQHVTASVAAALEEQFRRDAGRSSRLLQQLEAERLERLLCDWLTQIETERIGFSVVDLEECLPVAIGGLLLDGRVDRIDQLDDGALLCIDYKSGRLPKLADLISEPLLEPQLPAYAIASSTAPSGVLLAGMRRGELRWLGVGRSEAMPPGATGLTDADWQALLESWRRQVLELATAFGRGCAAVAPADRLRSCRYCDLGPLCRGDDLVPELSQDELV